MPSPRKIKPADFLVRPGETLRLDKRPTLVKPHYASSEEYHALLGQLVARLAAAQNLLYADDRYALLLIFQAMDAAGKDGVIKHVMSGINPQGCQVFSFKHPSAEELDHDFLWHAVHNLPERGRIGIFNRSYYEEVLIVRVHPELLAAERLPGIKPGRDSAWEERYRSIGGLEKHLHANGTRVIKFFLHISREEQRKRFLARIDDPEKNWKFSLADVAERKYWKQYMEAYEDCLAATSTRDSPWYVVPADDKQNTRLIVSRIIIDAMEGLGIHYPRSDATRRRELQAIRKGLAKSRNGRK